MSSASILLEIGRTKKEKLEYVIRRTQIQNVKDQIPGQTDDYVMYINLCISQATELLENGIRGLACVNSLCTQLENSKEEFADQDSYLSASMNDLASEIGDCDRKINELESDIIRLNNAYETALREEAEAARRAAEEAMKAAKKLAEKIF